MNYQKLDALILDAVASSIRSPLYNKLVYEEGKRIAFATGRDDMRVIDGRIQALRKAGKISFLSKSKAPNGCGGWYLSHKEDHA